MNTDLVATVFRPIKVMDIELSQPLPVIEGLTQYDKLQALIRLHSLPLGYLEMPLPSGRCTEADLSDAILSQYSSSILCYLTKVGVPYLSQLGNLTTTDLCQLPKPVYAGPFPLVTVVVCTRNRAADLKHCLDAIHQLDYPNYEVLVVDNAPSDATTEDLVRGQYPDVRYVCEPKPGLSWARNRSIVEAYGEIVAYTDDDVMVDAEWVTRLVKAFNDDKQVMAVTGLVVPYELETESQILFERHGGFGRGFQQKRYQVPAGKVPKHLLGGGQFGTGANMAYRKSLFDTIGGFNVALGAGTPSMGCEDHEMYFRVLKAGYALMYEPSALVRHRHRRNYETLRSQLANDGIGLYSYFVWAFLNCSEERWDFVKLALWWLWYGNLRWLWISFKYPNRFPVDLRWVELKGCFVGLTRYQKALKSATEIANDPAIAQHLHQLPLDAAVETSTLTVHQLEHQVIGIENSSLNSVIHISQTQEEFITSTDTSAPQITASSYFAQYGTPVALRFVELSQPLQTIADVLEYQKVRVFVSYNGQLMGKVDIDNGNCPITTSILEEAITNAFSQQLLEFGLRLGPNLSWVQAVSTLANGWHLKPNGATSRAELSTGSSVSIVVATYDRPDDLRHCLQSLCAQESSRSIEIIVVDNHPVSGLTAPVVEEFSTVKLVQEPRQGLAYARNAGIVASSGTIVAMTDDDVIAPPNWIEQLVAPFTRSDIMAVTGNVLPAELETLSQRLFETYGGLGRGFESFEVNGDWFECFARKAVTTWTLGATANAAFRACIFHHPKIGLMDEALGPGMPSGVGEDIYLFYKVLKAGYTILYNPQAHVWHKHRRTMQALRHQLFNYSKGHVAYHLTTLLRDKDWRGLVQILIGLPLAHSSRIYYRLRGWSDYPISLILLEILGNLIGPLALLQSRWRVMCEGTSTSYLPPSQRLQVFLKPDSWGATEQSHKRSDLISPTNS
ncbi:glycosyltransferase [Leptolyngbya sp. GB1-A1]|uniref:glycosyltransferase n=1 Tax=Leptolyngbya sp. GB1-A1 TaxID=2933908 RepID=UPI00329A614F